MKRFTLLLAGVFLLGSLFAQKGFRNPAAAYCELMGYRYGIEIDATGASVGMVLLPNDEKVNAWDFYKGKVGQDFTYGALRGFDVSTEVVDMGGFQVEVAVYSRSEKGGVEKFTQEELMEMFGDKLILESRKQGADIFEEAPVDPNFRASKALPTSFDWRSYNGHSYIGSVRDQGTCGSCYSFGAAACAEGAYNLTTGSYDSNTADFAEAYIAWCLSAMPAYSSHFSGCNGADYEYQELQALIDVGIIDETYFPYTDADNQSCPSAATSAPKTQFATWSRVTCNDIDAIKTAIMTYGVVDAAVYVTTAFQNYSGGIFTDSYTTCSTSPCYNTPTNHAISLVGWGTDATTGDYWILRNSWGSSWGESGYMRLDATSSRVGCSVCYMTYVSDGTTAPTVTSSSATSVGDNSAICGGTITSDGGSTVTASGVVYAKTSAPTLTTGTVVSTAPVTTSGSYSVTLSGLTSGTTYYARAYATNAKGTSYGSDVTFTTTGTTPVTYCTSLGSNYSYEWISGVTIGSFVSTSTAAGYTDFTSKTVTCAAGTAYSVSLVPGFASTTYSEYWKIWADLNVDGDFDDTGELVFDAGALSKTTVTGTLTIPSGTASATTRLRVSMKYNAAQTSCETFSYGEVEDYTLVVTASGANVAPVAEANGPYTSTLGTAITFSSTGSTDGDGTIASYAWNFGDGSTSTSANPSHTYAAIGTYTATLTVTDDDGATATDQATVTVSAAAATVTLVTSDFESGFGLWTDGGTDCMRYTGTTYAYAGTSAIDIQDNTTTSLFTLTTGIDVHTPGYVQIKVTFYFYALSMETGEDFWVQYYNGSTWSTVGTYTSGTSFSNGTFYTSTVTIDETSYTFPTAMKIRFKCDASNDSDDVYIDNVTITASTTKTAVQNQVVITELRKMDVSDAGETALSLYPNPTKGSSVTIVSGTEINNVMVYDITGKVVMTVEGENDTTMEIGVGNLNKGMYIVVVNHTDSKETTRFVIE
jgi:hypothetical protein